MITFLIIYVVTIIFIWYGGWRYMNEESHGDCSFGLVDAIKSANWIAYIPIINTIVVILAAIESLVDLLYKKNSE